MLRFDLKKKNGQAYARVNIKFYPGVDDVMLAIALLKRADKQVTKGAVEELIKKQYYMCGVDFIDVDFMYGVAEENHARTLALHLYPELEQKEVSNG